MIQALCHDLSCLESVAQQVTEATVQDATLREIFAVLTHGASKWVETAFPHMIQEVENPAREQLLTTMAMEPLNPNADEREQALTDCVIKMKKRHRNFQLQGLIEQRHSASGDHATELLSDYQRLKHGENSGEAVEANSV